MKLFFRRIPKLIWLGLFALILTILTGAIWTGLLIANLLTSSQIPWAVFAMAVLLWFMWIFLGGLAGPERNAEARRRSLRATPVSGPVFGWAILAGGLAIGALTGLWAVLFQLVKVKGNPLPDFSRYPLLTVVLVITMASLVTSAAEEAGFRGYFQGSLEERLGGPLAILIAALVIAPAHGLTQGFAWPTLLFYLLVDLSFGLMAYLTNSIIPGLVVHALGLMLFFTLVWPLDASRRLVAEGGADAWFWIHVGQTLVFAALSILAFRHLALVARRNDPKRSGVKPKE